jgi:hypothetical protein
MNYEIKVVSAKHYELTELRSGSRVQYIDFDIKKELYRCIIDPQKNNCILMPVYLANSILNKLTKKSGNGSKRK